MVSLKSSVLEFVVKCRDTDDLQKLGAVTQQRKLFSHRRRFSLQSHHTDDLLRVNT